jgi:glycosyltransferase involved in cell wall biosynthesis
MGVPFVTSPVGERLRLAGDPPAILLAQPAGDVQALALSIQSVLTSVELADSLRNRGLERVKDFSWDLLARELESVYLAALRKSNG